MLYRFKVRCMNISGGYVLVENHHSQQLVSSLTVVIVFIIARLVHERLRKFIVIVCVVC